jgi:hypothetical protein
MPSWRDSASPEAQEQLDELLNVVLPFAQQELEKHGEFFPYAAAIDASGEPELVAAVPAEGGERPASTDVIDACLAALGEKRERIQAAAVVADVSTPDGDAIRVELEHAEGHAIAVFLPYSKKRLGIGVDYGELHAQPGRPQVWTS